LVDPQCRSGVAGGTERSHVNKAVVIKLVIGRYGRQGSKYGKMEEKKKLVIQM